MTPTSYLAMGALVAVVLFLYIVYEAKPNPGDNLMQTLTADADPEGQGGTESYKFAPSDCNRWGPVDPLEVNWNSSSAIFAQVIRLNRFWLSNRLEPVLGIFQVPKTGTTTLSHMLRSLSSDLGWKWHTTPDFRVGMEKLRKQVHDYRLYQY